MRNICLIVSYDGTNYSGFQSQPHQNTIQDKLEQAIAMLTGERVKLVSSGRTDAGVHARGQVINFSTSSSIPIDRWSLALNNWLPRDIVILDAKQMPEQFHTRRSAKQKTYCYTINQSRFPDVFQRNFQYHHYAKLDVEAMKKALVHIVGEHDFTAFCSRKSVKESHIRTIYEAKIEQSLSGGFGCTRGQAEVLNVFITGNGFLYHMVRIIIGTLLQIGEGKKNSEHMLHILRSKNRAMSGPTAPAHGLTLWEVIY